MSQIETTIFDRATGKFVPATVLDRLSAPDVHFVESQWSVIRISCAARLTESGQDVPEHWHWDWRKKSSKLALLAYRCFGIKCQNEMQGLMMTSTSNCSARVAPDVGKPIIYIEYLEAAPWNVAPMVDTPRFGGVGLRLIECAIRYSQSEGFHGRVGLHSLPQAVAFYSKKCGMTSLGCDPKMDDLPYFEFTSSQANQFLAEEA